MKPLVTMSSRVYLLNCILISCFVIGCDQDSQFRGNSASELASSKPAQDSGDSVEAHPDVTQTNDPEENSENSLPEDDSLAEEIKVYSQDSETFSFGTPDPAIDYLFVIDNSVSMIGILDKVNQGFASLQSENLFPAKSKIAVMNTMIGDPNNFAITSSFVKKYSGIEYEPGFLDFVDKASIVNYSNLVPGKADKWTLEGCETKWFSPLDKNASGNYCLTAATQGTFSALGVEAGIHAVEQLFLKHAGNSIFRANALVNVIFVSDTHDPGINSQALVDSMPSYSGLVTLAQIDNRIAGLKFHALAPYEKCTGEDLHDRSYFKLVDESKGQKSDSCNTNDYQTFLRNMVVSSQIAEPKFKLKHPASTVSSVLVDRSPVNFLVSDDGEFVILNLDPKAPVKVTIVYEFELPSESM